MPSCRVATRSRVAANSFGVGGQSREFRWFFVPLSQVVDGVPRRQRRLQFPHQVLPTDAANQPRQRLEDQPRKPRCGIPRHRLREAVASSLPDHQSRCVMTRIGRTPIEPWSTPIRDRGTRLAAKRTLCHVDPDRRWGCQTRLGVHGLLHHAPKWACWARSGCDEPARPTIRVPSMRPKSRRS